MHKLASQQLADQIDIAIAQSLTTDQPAEINLDGDYVAMANIVRAIDNMADPSEALQALRDDCRDSLSKAGLA